MNSVDLKNGLTELIQELVAERDLLSRDIDAIADAKAKLTDAQKQSSYSVAANWRDCYSRLVAALGIEWRDDHDAEAALKLVKEMRAELGRLQSGADKVDSAAGWFTNNAAKPQPYIEPGYERVPVGQRTDCTCQRWTGARWEPEQFGYTVLEGDPPIRRRVVREPAMRWYRLRYDHAIRCQAKDNVGFTEVQSDGKLVSMPTWQFRLLFEEEPGQ